MRIFFTKIQLIFSCGSPASKIFQKSNNEICRKQKGDKGTYPSCNITVTHEKRKFVIPVYAPLKNRRLPPLSLVNYITPLVNKCRYSCIGTSGYAPSCLYRPEAGISEMLSVARRVAPPGIVCDNSEHFRPFAGLTCAIFTIDRFIADRTSHIH